ncbi:unnamed protein product [Candida verbasci]|uniref:Uncharacterized protein n=1 Tax=Candida verbasci TaxID=1227364 RepID=A0A9W4XD20_9ASCO|nr:unnamed protein product [Candida verbasci]
MPPQIIFLQITDNISTPIKVFVRRSTTNGKPSSLSINQKSLITLKNKYHIKLSKNYLDNIIEDLKEDLEDILFHKNDVYSNIEVNKKGYKCIIPQSLIIGIRIELDLMNMEYVEKKPNNYNNLDLLIKEKMFIEQEEEEEEKSKVKLISCKVFGDLSNCIKIYIE